MPEYRVLLMDPVNADSSSVSAAEDAVRNGLTEAAPHINVVCVRGTEEREKSRDTSWPEWCTHVATGVHYEQRTPLFNAIAVMDKRVGKSTASIMSQALEAGRMGLCVREGQLHRVVGVETRDFEDWKSGWTVVLQS